MDTLEVVRRKKTVNRPVWPMAVPLTWNIIQKARQNYERGMLGHALIAKLTPTANRSFHLEMFLCNTVGDFVKADFRTAEEAKEFVNNFVAQWLNTANLKLGPSA